MLENEEVNPLSPPPPLPMNFCFPFFVFVSSFKTEFNRR